jgi:HEAT repeat protein
MPVCGLKHITEQLQQNPDPLQRASAAKALGRVRDLGAASLKNSQIPLEDAVPSAFSLPPCILKAIDALIAATSDTEAAVVQAATRSLGKLRVERACGPLITLLRHEVASVRVEAVVALGGFLADRHTYDLRELFASLADDERRVRSEAEQNLRIGNPITVLLTHLLGDLRGDVAESAGKILGQMGTVALDTLLESLASSEWRRRKSAAVGLAEILSNYLDLNLDGFRRCVTALQTALDDRSAKVRSAVAEALGESFFPASVTDHWRFHTQGHFVYIRDADAKTVQDLAQSSIPGLVQALNDPISRVRASAAAALGEVSSPTTRGALLEMLKRPMETERIAAAKALVHAHDPEDATGIVAALADGDARVRYAIVLAIKSLTRAKFAGEFAAGFYLWPSGPPDIPAAVSQIVSALARLVHEERNTIIRRAAVQALEMIGETIRQWRETPRAEAPVGGSVPLADRFATETEQEILAHDAIVGAALQGETARFTDLCFYEGHLFPGDSTTAARRLQDQEALCAGHEYTLEVAIRRERFGIAAATPAPRAVLNPRRTTETLKIFVVVRLLHGPATITEPVQAVDWPYDADSSSAFFRLILPDRLSKPEEATVEVRLFHENLDLLDVVNLYFFVIADRETDVLPSCIDWPRSSNAEPRLDPDTAIRKLNIRIRPAVEGYELEFIFLRPDREISLPVERHVTPGDLEILLTKVRDFWTELSITNYENQLSVTLATWNRYLVRLYELGAEAWEILFGSRGGGQKGASETIGDLLAEMDVVAGTHVQITYEKGITGFVFPWSILYPFTDRGAAVDPFLFWGAKYQIEQVWEGGSHDGLETEPVGVAVIIDPGFGEVQPEIEMFEAFKANASGRLEIGAPIANRQGLFTTLNNSPSHHFYYFFCHGYAPAGPPLMRRDSVRLLRESIEALPPLGQKVWDKLLALTAKMADEAWIFIGDAQITESELRRTWGKFNQRRPILFLNMCQSAAVVPSNTRGLLRMFREGDAAALIGTESPMTSVFAHAFARELLKHLFGGEDLGTALWLARRHFLANEVRNPLGLAYTLYGRATAKLGMSPLVAAELA